MGRDKAMLELEGTSFLERIAATMRPLVASVRVVGRAGDIENLPSIEDLRPGLGPLAAIETALAAAAGVDVLVVACDLPLISTALLALVVECARSAPGSIAVPLDSEGRLAPLAAVYPTSALARVASLLDAGERKPRALLDIIPTVVLPFEDYANLPGALHLLRNVNTPEDWDRARSLWNEIKS